MRQECLLLVLGFIAPQESQEGKQALHLKATLPGGREWSSTAGRGKGGSGGGEIALATVEEPGRPHGLQCNPKDSFSKFCSSLLNGSYSQESILRIVLWVPGGADMLLSDH